MPYAVTCKSCGARFSVADDLVQRKFAGKVVTLRCKRCHEPIRINASEPPGRRSSRPPSPAARAPLPQGPARPKPRPPLKQRPERRKPPPPARLRERDETPAEANHDLFDAAAAPPSSRRYIDVSDMAHSEPPGPNSSTPPLFDLAHGESKAPPRVGDDVDFLLGLTGSPGTAAALVSPSLSNLAREVETEPPRSRPSPPAPATAAQPTAAAPQAASAQAPSAAPKKRTGLVLALAGLLAAVAVGAQLTTRQAPPAEPSDALAPTTATPRGAEPELTAAEPAELPAVAAPATSEETALEQPSPEPAVGAATPAEARAEPPKQVSAPVAANAKPPAPPAALPAVEKAVIPPKPEAAAPGTAFNRAAAASALSNAAADASACRKAGDPSGVASVTVTFAPSGRVTSANVSGPPFAGTATGGCIAATLRRAKVPAFDGELVTVGKTIVVQ